MKKLITLTSLLLCCCLLHAQTEEKVNSYIIGGSFNFFTQNNTYPLASFNINSGLGGIYSGSTNESKNTNFAFTPYIGNVINKNWLLGGQLDFRLGNYKTENVSQFPSPGTVDFERKSNQVGLGIFGRYLLNPDDKLNVYLQPFIEFNRLNEKELQNGDTTQKEKVTYIEAGIGAGALYKINDKLSATLRIGGLSYVNGKWEVEDSNLENDFSSFGLNVNISSIFFGVELNL